MRNNIWDIVKEETYDLK